MKILVIGGTGMVGHTIALYLKERGHQITSLSRRKSTLLNSISMDLKDFNSLESLITNNQYDVIVNSAGILNEIAEEFKSDSILLNSFLPHFLSDLTKSSVTKIIHLSTDCVFSGKTGGYLENSFRDGETFYDRSKALGEIENKKDLTFRNSIIGPDINEGGVGLFNWFMKQSNPINGFTNVLWSGVTTLTLAKAIETAIYQNLVGIYNLVNNNKISKHDLLSLFNQHIRSNKLIITPYSSTPCDKSLINSRTDFLFNIPSYESMVIEMKNWINLHLEIYSHYKEKLL